MMKRQIPYFLLTTAVLALTATGCGNKALKKTEHPQVEGIKVPAGFRVTLFADEIENARSMTMGANGTIFVGTRKSDKVYALVDEDKDGKADKKYIIAEGLDMPNGVAFKDGALYVSEVSRIWRFDNIEEQLDNPPQKVLISDNYPSDNAHGWKYIAFGPDGKLYVPVGAPCNICNDNEQDTRYASITRMNADGSGFEVFANGIRNTVGFAWHPQTNELWFTDNGRDNLGDDVPNDELNRAPQGGMHFGYPYCHAGDIADPEFGDGHPCSNYTAPVQKLLPHTAALGMKFYTGNMFPAAYKNRIFIAEHGSWNRTEPIGYRVSMVTIDGNNAVSYEPFATGWLKDGEAWGRPVDILQLPDGSLLVSDDFANSIYRISYQQ